MTDGKCICMLWNIAVRVLMCFVAHNSLDGWCLLDSISTLYKYTSRHGRGRAAFISIFGTENMENGEQVCEHHKVHQQKNMLNRQRAYLLIHVKGMCSNQKSKETTNSIISLSKPMWLIFIYIVTHCIFSWMHARCKMWGSGKGQFIRILAGRFSEQWNRFWNLLGPLQTKGLLNVLKS